ncbi:hypothetical protein FB451DRAFT_1181836 [Mycena latifolia]|nr:hypothetical protein FB451DRAFT_1181836 [Mycena latifolia]
MISVSRQLREQSPVRGARKRNGKEGWLDGGLNSGLPAKEVLVQEPWQDALQLRHRVANTKQPERMERGLRVIKKVGNTGKGLDGGSNSGLSDTECVSTTLSSRRRRKPDRRRVRTGHRVSETRADKSGLRNRCLTKDGAVQRRRKSNRLFLPYASKAVKSLKQHNEVFGVRVELLAKEVGGAEPAGSRLQQANGYFGRLWFVVQEAPKSIFHLGLDELDPASPSKAPPQGSVEQIQSPLTREG